MKIRENTSVLGRERLGGTCARRCPAGGLREGLRWRELGAQHPSLRLTVPTDAALQTTQFQDSKGSESACSPQTESKRALQHPVQEGLPPGGPAEGLGRKGSPLAFSN